MGTPDPQPTSTPLIPALGRRFLTGLYDPVVALVTRERFFKRELLRLVPIPEGAAILDLGCGTGTLAVSLARSFPTSSVTGMDGDETVLRRARRKSDAAGLRIRFDRELAPTLPYASDSFDLVVSTLFFHHLVTTQKVETASAVLRVLKTGGTFHVADWGQPTSRLMRMLFYPVQLLDGFETTADNANGRLPEIIEAAGFLDVHVRREIYTICGTLAFYSGVKP